MLLNQFILFFSSFFAGISVFLFPRLDKKHFRMLLSFSGAYLFSMTVIHILPELFHESQKPVVLGVFVLMGFFLQQVLEFFSTGIEHGHIHLHHHEGGLGGILLLISLSLHSLLEGTLLVHPSHAHAKEEIRNLLFGLVLHKLPEAFALASVLLYRTEKHWLTAVLLVLFSFTSPAGLWLSSFVSGYSWFSGDAFNYLFALVAGNFLHISTTIFFESSPDHQFKINKLLVTLAGAAIAIGAELLL